MYLIRHIPKQKFIVMEESKSMSDINSIRCIGNQPVTYICISKYCKQPALRCSDQNCKCTELKHVNCSFQSFQQLFSQITKKRRQMPSQYLEAYQSIIKHYDKIIQQLSLDRMHYQQLIKMYGLKEATRQFINSINSGDSQNITGTKVRKVFEQLSVNMGRFLNQKGILKKDWQKTTTLFENLRSSLNQYLTNRSIDSQIIARSQEDIIKKFLPKKDFFDCKISLLYRASEDGFSSEKFHHNCDKQESILVIAKTQFDKIIGSYTPLGWDNKQSMQMDNSGKSCIFSVTLSKKFSCTYKGQKPRIHNSKQLGPSLSLGSQCEIFIKNNCNTEYNQLKLSHQFKKSKFPTFDACLALIGTKQERFLIRDYEVFSVIWQP